MHRLYLSRRNLQTLLAALDRGASQSAIMKNDTSHAQYPTSVPTLVIALEDSEYYPRGYHESPRQIEAPPPEPPPITAGPIKVSRRRKKED